MEAGIERNGKGKGYWDEGPSYSLGEKNRRKKRRVKRKG